MVLNLQNRKRTIIYSVILLIALIPISITAFELITTGKDSVVFLEGYPAPIVLLALIYYGILFLLGIMWLIKQIIGFYKLKNESNKAELIHLKNQVSPHFFFNTLNNLYGLVEVDTQKAQSLILKLSDLMRYSIYDGEKDSVPLTEEVEYLQNYMDLHKMRYQKHIEIGFDCKVEHDHKVMPLIFINLLENAFKHGVEKLRDQAFVHVKLFTFENGLQFEIVNNFDTEMQPTKDGIGITNLTRRLELVYPRNYELKKEIVEDRYKVVLRLNKL